MTTPLGQRYISSITPLRVRLRLPLDAHRLFAVWSIFISPSTMSAVPLSTKIYDGDTGLGHSYEADNSHLLIRRQRALANKAMLGGRRVCLIKKEFFHWCFSMVYIGCFVFLFFCLSPMHLVSITLDARRRLNILRKENFISINIK